MWPKLEDFLEFLKQNIAETPIFVTQKEYSLVKDPYERNVPIQEAIGSLFMVATPSISYATGKVRQS